MDLSPYAAVILCGGKSSRMGFDKALMVREDGQTLIAATASELAARFGEVVLACGSPERLGGAPGLEGYRRVFDRRPHAGPAGAVAAALEALEGRSAFVMAGDMTTVDWGVIERLAGFAAAGAEAAVPVHGGRLEPLYAFYSARAARPLAEAAETGRGTLREALARLRTRLLELGEGDMEGDPFLNVNTPIEARAAGLSPPPGLAGPSAGSSAGADMNELLRTIPKVDRVMALAAQSDPRLAALSREALLEAARAALARRRESLASLNADPDWDPVAAVAAEARELARPSLRPVINATGVVLHTNLGRAPLAAEAISAVVRAASGYSTLEWDPASGRRRSRQAHVEGLITDLIGGEAALVVNNNAAALALVAAALAPGRPVVVSRGELVEIGESFRLADILTAGGAVLREVGSTNRTVVADYERAMADGAPALILGVHVGNFRLVGYGGRPAVSDLINVARRHGVPLVYDLGSGSVADLCGRLPEEPRAAALLAQGVSLATMSGDKLMGAGQAGVIAGREDLVAALRAHPLARAVRIDKLSLSALEATLRLSGRPKEALGAIPVLAMLNAPLEELQLKAGRLLAAAGQIDGLTLTAAPLDGQAGGGSGPATSLPSWGVAVAARSPGALEAALRRFDPPVVGRIFGNRLWLDVRTIGEAELATAAEALRAAARSLGEPEGEI